MILYLACNNKKTLFKRRAKLPFTIPFISFHHPISSTSFFLFLFLFILFLFKLFGMMAWRFRIVSLIWYIKSFSLYFHACCCCCYYCWLDCDSYEQHNGVFLYIYSREEKKTRIKTQQKKFTNGKLIEIMVCCVWGNEIFVFDSAVCKYIYVCIFFLCFCFLVLLFGFCFLWLILRRTSRKMVCSLCILSEKSY